MVVCLRPPRALPCSCCCRLNCEKLLQQVKFVAVVDCLSTARGTLQVKRSKRFAIQSSVAHASEHDRLGAHTLARRRWNKHRALFALLSWLPSRDLGRRLWHAFGEFREAPREGCERLRGLRWNERSLALQRCWLGFLRSVSTSQILGVCVDVLVEAVPGVC